MLQDNKDHSAGVAPVHYKITQIIQQVWHQYATRYTDHTADVAPVCYKITQIIQQEWHQ